MTKYIVTSLTIHFFALCIFIFSFAQTSLLPVIENTNEHDVISAVILGDNVKSNIIAPPKNTPPVKTVEPPKPIEPPTPAEPLSPPKPKPVASNEKDVIVLKPIPKKNPSVESDKKLRALFGKNLLADIKKTKEKQKIKHQKQLQAKFEQTLKKQAEESLRQQIINENIKLQGDKIRKSQGQVSKYKALILQAISTHWIMPSQIKRNLTLSVMIRLAPGGMVLDVQVTRSSGNAALDSSVRAAIINASPLPVPSSLEEFEVFRQFILKVKPENIMSNEALMRRV